MKRVRAARWRPRLILFLLGLAGTAIAGDSPTRATYDAAGRLTSLIQGGAALSVQTEFIVNFVGGVQASMQPETALERLHPFPERRHRHAQAWLDRR
jgi:hypothetical protein